jgi:hypothetical protein
LKNQFRQAAARAWLGHNSFLAQKGPCRCLALGLHSGCSA